MNSEKGRNFLLYLKALVWSIFVSYDNETVEDIVQCVKTGTTDRLNQKRKDSHLGRSLDFILQQLTNQQDRETLASVLTQVKTSEPSIIYQNMVFEMGHYVTSKDAFQDVPMDCPGIVFHLEANKISVLFVKPANGLSPHRLYPHEVLPVYTLTIPDSTA